jgi:alpha-D-ribose 1-methylphosphonate 5-triphosphate synthase subunit PhnI
LSSKYQEGQLLTSALVKEFVESHNISVQVGDIFKHMSLPQFDSKLSDHKAMAKLVKKAHSQAYSSARALTISKVQECAHQIINSSPVVREQWI